MTMILDGSAGATFPDSSVQAKSAQGPAFRAWNSSVTSIPSATNTRIALQSKTFDTASAFDSTTNYRFQPTVAGYYQLIGAVAVASPVSGFAVIYKNGSQVSQGQYSTGSVYVVSDIIFLNGSTDYLELWAYQTSGGAVNTSNTSTSTYFAGALVRAA